MNDDTATLDGDAFVPAAGVGPDRDIEIVSPDGRVAHIVQYADGTIGVRTDGMRPSGQIVTIRPDGWVEVTPVD